MVKEIPKWLERGLDLAGAKRIEEAVKRAERSTSGEIVPMLVQHSAVNALAPMIMALLFLLIILGVKHSLFLIGHPFDSEFAWSLILLLGALAGFFLGRLPTVQRFLLPRDEKRRQARERAMLEFYAAGLNHTRGGTGILLFVSWEERQAVVLADEGIAKHCQPHVFEEVVNDLIRGAKRHDVAGGFEEAVARCAALLVPYFPRAVDDSNELKDYLIIKD